MKIGKYYVDLILRLGSFWMGAHQSHRNHCWCINLIPCVTVRIGTTEYKPDTPVQAYLDEAERIVTLSFKKSGAEEAIKQAHTDMLIHGEGSVLMEEKEGELTFRARPLPPTQWGKATAAEIAGISPNPIFDDIPWKEVGTAYHVGVDPGHLEGDRTVSWPMDARMEMMRQSLGDVAYPEGISGGEASECPVGASPHPTDSAASSRPEPVSCCDSPEWCPTCPSRFL